jgi:hypothetical protein
MFELAACSATVVVYVALWLAIYKFGGVDWADDNGFAWPRRQLSDAYFAAEGEIHGASQRVSPAGRATGQPHSSLFETVAAHARLSLPT